MEYTLTELNAIFSIRINNKRFDHRGVRCANLYYNSGDLARIATQSGKRTVNIRINPANIGSVLVWDDHRDCWIFVPCLMPSYAEGLSLWAHLRVSARLRQYEESEDKASGVVRPLRARSIDLSRYLKNEAALLKDVLHLTGVPARHKRRDLRAAAAHLGRSLDVATAVARLDVIDIRAGRVPPGMGPLIDLEKSDDGTYRQVPKGRVSKRKSDNTDPFIGVDAPIAPDMSVDPFASFDPDEASNT